MIACNGLDVLARMLQSQNSRIKTAASMMLSNLFSNDGIASIVQQNEAISAMLDSLVDLLVHDDVGVCTVVARVIAELLKREEQAAKLLQLDGNLFSALDQVLEQSTQGTGSRTPACLCSFLASGPCPLLAFTVLQVMITWGVHEMVLQLLSSKVEELHAAALLVLHTAVVRHCEQRPRHVPDLAAS